MSFFQPYIADIIASFQRHKKMAEKAFAQVDANADFFRKPGEHSNSVALIVKHLAGNLASRWTDFLTSDGDKPWRDRDNEFIIGPEDTREKLLRDWETGWNCVVVTLNALHEDDMTKTVIIRREEHSVLQAIHRSLTHVAYHTGQILYVARLVKPDAAAWITIAPGRSEQAREQGGKYLK